MDVFNNLNEIQKDIVLNNNTNNKQIILSCAGSGKTHVIILRIYYMIKYLNCSPNQILLLTYNKNASKEMQYRLNSLLINKKILCGTFHKIAFKLLSQYDTNFIDDNYHVDESQNLLYKFLCNNQILNDKIKYIFIDEFQDINNIQLKIMKKLNSFCNSLYLVGDDLQNIYSFRGSDGNLEKILNVFPNFDIIKMNYNYRSAQDIINLANNIQEKNSNKIKNLMISTKEKCSLPKIHVFESLSKEINFIVNSIKNDLKKGYLKKDIVVLSRNNILLYFIEEQLQKKKIKNTILTSQNYLDDCIALSTIHSSKGLEWDKVYLVGMNNSYFPNSNSDIEEERRLFYVAVTRCKYNMVLTFNKNNKCSNLILELSQKLFYKDFNFNDIIYNINDLPQELKIDNSVTKIISRLNGEDYIKLKKLNIFNNVNFTTKKIYNKYNYPFFIEKENYYSEFGCFIDYLIRKMINNDIDNRAKYVITSIYLNNIQYHLWNQYNKGIINCVNHLISNNKISSIYIKNLFKRMYKLKEINDQINEIINLIYQKMKLFNLDINDINIVNKLYIPFELQQKYNCYYLKYKNNNNWKDIIWDIFNISKCHHIWGNRKKCLYIDINKNDVLKLDNFYNDIFNFINSISKNKKCLLNPKLSNNYIYGDADLIIDNEIMDFKTSINKDINIEFTLQLLLYTSLAKQKNININKISIFNPLLGLYHYCDITKWNNHDELLNYIYKIIN